MADVTATCTVEEDQAGVLYRQQGRRKLDPRSSVRARVRGEGPGESEIGHCDEPARIPSDNATSFLPSWTSVVEAGVLYADQAGELQ